MDNTSTLAADIESMRWELREVRDIWEARYSDANPMPDFYNYGYIGVTILIGAEHFSSAEFISGLLTVRSRMSTWQGEQARHYKGLIDKFLKQYA